MKICFLGQDNLPVLAREYNRHGVGGAQVQMTLIAKALAMRGHDVSMVVGDYGQEDGRSWDGIRTFKTFKANAGFPVIRFIHPHWSRTWMALSRADADVYFTSCAGMQVGLLALYCMRVNKGFVFRLAHDDDADPQKMLVRLWRDKKLYEYGLKRAESILCQNNTQRDRLKTNYALEASLIKSLVEPPAIDHPLQDRNIETLWVSNLRDIKRPDLALELARRLPHRRLHMVGGRQAGFTQMYETIQREATVLPNLTFHGRVPYHEVGDLFDRTRVFVNTSDSEGFPNTYLQSWRRGVPVVAFFDPDALIRREELGYAVSSMDEMQQAVEKLLSDDDEWHRISNRCRAYMERHHGDDVVLRPYLEAIEHAYTARRPA
jgi:glycosyltransferase involved in cell wall biosynthesis